MTLKLKVRGNECALRTPDIWHIYASECAYVFFHWILMYRNATCSTNGFQCIPKSTLTHAHIVSSNVSIARCHAQKRSRRARERVCNCACMRRAYKILKLRFSWKTIISMRSRKNERRFAESIVFHSMIVSWRFDYFHFLYVWYVCMSSRIYALTLASI